MLRQLTPPCNNLGDNGSSKGFVMACNQIDGENQRLGDVKSWSWAVGFLEQGGLEQVICRGPLKLQLFHGWMWSPEEQGCVEQEHSQPHSRPCLSDSGDRNLQKHSTFIILEVLQGI